MAITGKSLIDYTMYDTGKYQVLTADTALRAIILTWANRILLDISTRHNHWTWLEVGATFPTVAGQMPYSLPSAIDLTGKKMFTIRDAVSGNKLIYYDQRRFDEIEPNPTASGNPLYYTYWATGLKLYPIPSGILTMSVRYIKKITAVLDDTTTTTELPDKWQDVVIDGIKKYAYRMFPEWGDGNVAMAQYEAGIRRMWDENNIGLDDDQVTERHIVGTRQLPTWDRII